ncbi:MAG TPA: hypothetical protein PKE03_12655 [Bacteroidales bacterium]|nr:hypothetical protein [Bacteroidales bacterium]
MKPGLPEIGIVVYGASASRLERLRRWATNLGTKGLLIIENKAATAQGEVLQGDNRYSEFSAYLQLCNLFEGAGPYLIVNDTLVRTHWTAGWSLLCRKVLRSALDEKTIIGDIRNDRDTIPGKPSTYLASWIFIIPTRRELEAFREVLEKAVVHPDTLPAAYNTWLDQWLKPSSIWRGWHLRADEAALQRKRFCIITEHRISQLLPQSGLHMVSAGAFSPLLYRWIRLADRLKTRLHALKSRL